MSRTQLELKYIKSIHEALYPRWGWSGGYIIANVFDNGKKVVLECYAEPSLEESAILSDKIQNCLDTVPEIFWKLIGGRDEINLKLINESSSQITVKRNVQKPVIEQPFQTSLQQQVTTEISNLLDIIYKKAEQDIETVKRIQDSTINYFSTASDSVIQCSKQGIYFIQNNYTQIVDGTIKVIEPLRQELIKYPDDWLRKLNKDTLAKVDQAEKTFYIIKEKNKHKKTDKLATAIIIESLKKSTLARFIDSGIYVISSSLFDMPDKSLSDCIKPLSDWIKSLEDKNYPFLNQMILISEKIDEEIRKTFEQPKTSDLMLAMIVQIACVYERANFHSSEKQAELVCILIISFLCSLAVDMEFIDFCKKIISNLNLEQILQKMGISYDKDLINKIQKNIAPNNNLVNLLQNFLVSISMNIALFLLVGFIAKYIYQNYDKIFEIIGSINLYNQIKAEASKSVLEITQKTNIIENAIVECYQTGKLTKTSDRI